MILIFTFIIFIVAEIFWHTLALFHEIEFIYVIILSLLTSICISVPYYAHKILKELRTGESADESNNTDNSNKFY